MSETGETAAQAEAEAIWPKVARARMIVELDDGRALYWEAREPLEAEVEHLTADPRRWGELGPMRAGAVADWLHGGGWFPPQPRAVLRITGGIPWQVRIMQDSGEIPPELADRMIAFIDKSGLRRPGGTLAMLRPYLARIAGKP